MPKTAVMWIRDGVLIDRMPVNAVAFAVACLRHARAEQLAKINLTVLVNYAFQTSGISCADKMHKFNAEVIPLIGDVRAAAVFYSQLTEAAASQCEYFPGACELVRLLQESGVLNFITSAVDQDVLDRWAQTSQGKLLVPHLTEILGRRSDGLEKGKEHFMYVHKRYGVQKILYVADAVAEISSGVKFSQEFNISTIGFAHLITNENVRRAYELVMEAHERLSQQTAPAFPFAESDLSLPDEDMVQAALKGANATDVVSGNPTSIMGELAACLKTYECPSGQQLN